jgi:hypothetical protein
MITLALSRGKTAVIDDADADLAAMKWYAEESGRTFYPRRNVIVNGKSKSEYLYHVIAARMGIQGQIDHRDHDGLNCTRRNLRSATQAQNNANQRLRLDNTSGVKGVSRHGGKWQAKIKVNGKSRYLGLHCDIREAEAAVRAAREAIHGEFACHGDPALPDEETP